MVDPFKEFRLHEPTRVHLDRIDPAQRPFSVGDKAADREQLAKLSGRLLELQDRFYAANSHKLLLVLQGMDTAGKDGTIKAVFQAVDPLGVRAVSYREPTLPELAHDFLWRHHRDVPGKGEIVIFNRSHYEAVLTEFVNGIIDDDERQRRFGHIKAFERMLSDTGTVSVKCFLHISKAEQQRRLQQRIDDPDKRWKFQASDLQARSRWKQYQAAYESVLEATAASHAPWYVVPSDSRSHRNLMVMEILLHVLDGLNLRYPRGSAESAGLKIS
jgi:PPK2 family polyphosphate:nucleotide phosphotransferase